MAELKFPVRDPSDGLNTDLREVRRRLVLD